MIVEKDTSASIKRGAKRSHEWEHVKALVEDGKADAIVSRHYDRMYRTPWDLEDLVDLAESTGVTLAAAQAQGVLDLSTPSGRLAARIGAVVARNETERRAERQVLGHQRRRESGRPFWSTRPFGFGRTEGRRATQTRGALEGAQRERHAPLCWPLSTSHVVGRGQHRCGRQTVFYVHVRQRPPA
ncbi:recombinase family protein [Streptomyces sp. NBC_00846]|uniref:recombinase family protein n=1 Tax=Streptomyces sp. NBC_00846 TaxID=2975849 RepID=UPI00386BD514|nr:recombinase family protein [Streptomyces sp. NBC_00846]